MLPHRETHRLGRAGWLRASVLGANDGIVSTASLVVGIASAGEDHGRVLLVGLAGLVAGALSMAAGEYVSVSSQADMEAAELKKEREELASDPEKEHAELAGIYRSRGLSADLAEQVADQLSAGDALAAHARDELGITDFSQARPILAAAASAAAFAAGAVMPIIAAALSQSAQVGLVVSSVTIASLAVLGAVGARLGGAPPGKAALRVMLASLLALGASAGIGRLLGASLG